MSATLPFVPLLSSTSIDSATTKIFLMGLFFNYPGFGVKLLFLNAICNIFTWGRWGFYDTSVRVGLGEGQRHKILSRTNSLIFLDTSRLMSGPPAFAGRQARSQRAKPGRWVRVHLQSDSGAKVYREPLRSSSSQHFSIQSRVAPQLPAFTARHAQSKGWKMNERTIWS